jgi:hypothetical protein
MPLLLARRLVVTNTALIVGDGVVPLDEIVRVRLSTTTGSRSGSPIILEIERRGAALRARLPGVPEGFVEALRSLSIGVVLREAWWI